jgi:hypothetical protein
MDGFPAPAAPLAMCSTSGRCWLSLDPGMIGLIVAALVLLHIEHQEPHDRAPSPAVTGKGSLHPCLFDLYRNLRD